MRFLAVAVVGFVALASGGCVIEKPLSDPATSESDERLLGHWKSDAPGKVHLFIGKHVVKGNPKSLLEMCSVELEEDRIGNNTEKSYVSLTKIGKSTYLNLFLQDKGTVDLSKDGSYDEWAKKPKRSCMLYKYETDGKQLTLRMPKFDLLEKLISSGKLKAPADQSALTTVESLTAYLREHGDEELFAEVGEKFRDQDGAFVFKKQD